MIIEKAPKKIKQIIEAYCSLSTRQKIILEHRWCKRMSQEEVAKILKLTAERIRQLEEEAINIIIKEIS